MELEDPGRWFGQAFSKAKALYKQTIENGFYVTTRSHDGLHLAILPRREDMVFSEYRPGDQVDVEKVTHLIGVREFKSFYCSICTVEEEDNIAARQLRNGDYKTIDNPADKISSRFSEEGEPFLLTATKPQYLYNHLLLSSVSHRSTYLLFLYEGMFSSLLKIIRQATQTIPGLVSIFNGNYGSDAWHAHLHLTNVQKFSIVEKVKADGALMTNGIYSYQDGVIKAVVVTNSDIGGLYKDTSQLFLNIFHINLTNKYLAANIFYANNRFYVIVLYGNNVRVVKVGQQSVFLINPSYIVNVNDVTVNTKFLDALSKRVIAEGIYENILENYTRVPLSVPDYFDQQYRIAQGDIRLLPVECIQYRYLTKKDFCSDVFNDKRSIVRLCAQNCDPPQFATYKYLLSLLMFCYVSKKGYGFPNLMNDDDILNQAIKGEISRMRKYGTNTTSLYLSGIFAKNIVLKTYENLIILSPPSGASSLLPQKDYKINRWINYSGRKIGDASAYGTVTKNVLSVESVDVLGTDFIIKAIKSTPRSPDVSTAYEIAVGLKVNDLRKVMPNFVMTLGGFMCNSPDPLLEIPQSLCTGGIHVNYIVQEYISGNTLAFSLLKESPGDHDVLFIILQVLVVLYIAAIKTGFTHYDIHPGNIMIYRFLHDPEFRRVTGYDPKIHAAPPNVIFRYHLPSPKGDIAFNVPAWLCCFFIDFGKTFIRGLRQEPYVSAGDYSLGMTSNVSKPWVDVYGFLIGVFEYILAGKNAALLINGGMWRLGTPLVDLFFRVLDDYKIMFGNIEKLKFDLLNLVVSFYGVQYDNIINEVRHVFTVNQNSKLGVAHFRYIPPTVTVNMIKNDHRAYIDALLGLYANLPVNFVYNWNTKYTDLGLTLFSQAQEEAIDQAEKQRNMQRKAEIKNL